MTTIASALPFPIAPQAPYRPADAPADNAPPRSTFATHFGRALRAPDAPDPADDRETRENDSASDDDAPSTDGTTAPTAHKDVLNDLRNFVERVADSGRQPASAAANANANPDAGTTRTPAPADPQAVVHDLSALDPALRVRVERVITRMEAEHGHDVQIGETWRSQARQDRLHEQGRTRPGQVVTWTTNSKHTQGLAADLVIDGSWDNPQAYAQLQKIAQEEGLKTLGAKDPGHVELGAAQRSQPTPEPADVSPAVALVPVTIVEAPIDPLANAFKPDVVPLVADQPPVMTDDAPVCLAPVATVASVAQVASVARVAPARVAEVAGVEAPAAVRANVHTGAAGTETDGKSDSREENARSSAAPFTPQSTRATAPDFVLPAAMRSDSASRAEHVAALRDLVRSQPMSGLVLRVDSADGVDDRIRIDMRGSRVDTSISVNNDDRLADLTRRVPELARALEARGFEAGSAQVRPALQHRPGVEDLISFASRAADQHSQDALGLTPFSRAQSRGAGDEQSRSQQQAYQRQRQRRERHGDQQ